MLHGYIYRRNSIVLAAINSIVLVKCQFEDKFLPYEGVQFCRSRVVSDKFAYLKKICTSMIANLSSYTCLFEIMLLPYLYCHGGLLFNL